MAMLQSLNKDTLDTDEETFDAREYLYEHLAEATGEAGRRMLFIFDGIDPDSPDAIFTEMASIASMPFISTILLTTEPIQHPKLQVRVCEEQSDELRRRVYCHLLHRF